jgi:hypothetical protein
MRRFNALKLIAASASLIMTGFMLYAGSQLPAVAELRQVTEVTPRAGLSYYGKIGDPDLSERNAPLPGHLYFEASPAKGLCRAVGPALGRVLCPSTWHEIGTPHAVHDDIAARGGGRFSIWDGMLIFSTRDGADPNGPGRYWLLVENPVAALRLALLFAVPGIVSLWLLRRLAWRSIRTTPTVVLAALRRTPQRARRAAGGVILFLAFSLWFIGPQFAPFGVFRAVTEITLRTGLSFSAPLGSRAVTDRDPDIRTHLYLETSPPGAICARLGPALGEAFAMPVCGEHWQDFGRPRAEHADIAALGAGRFSVWDGTLIFSTPDKSDPRVTGRYWLFVEHPAAWGAVTAAAALLGAALVLYRRISRQGLLKALAASLAIVALLIIVRQDPLSQPLALSGLALVAMALLRLAPSRISGWFLALPLIGLVGGSWALDSMLQSAEWIRNVPVEKGLHQMLQQEREDKFASLMIMGSSYADNAIDMPVLKQSLLDNGHQRQPIGFADGGISPIERTHYLNEYLKRTSHPPREALLEVSLYYDLFPGPMYYFETASFSQNAINTMDSVTTFWALKWELSEDRRGLLRQVAGVKNILAHFLLNAVNAGLIPNGVRVEPGFPAWLTPICAPTGMVTAENVSKAVDVTLAAGRGSPLWGALWDGERNDFAKRADAISANWGYPARMAIQHGLQQAPDADWHPSPWLDALLDYQIQRLRDAGTRRLAFFTTPTLLAPQSRYTLNFCQDRTDLPCLRVETSDLPDQLRHPQAWVDFGHVCDTVRKPYSQWLAQAVWPILSDTP